MNISLNPKLLNLSYIEVKVALKRLGRNPILILHAVGGIFRIFGYLGYYIFKPKYMEMQYRQSASGASFITGSTSIVTMALGIMGGGLLIRHFKPKPRSLTTYMFIVEMFASFAILSAMFVGCPTPQFPNTQIQDGRSVLHLLVILSSNNLNSQNGLGFI